MIFPYNVDVPMQRRPWANWGLILATAIIGFPCWSDPQHYILESDSYFLYLDREDFRWYQLIGNLFGHAGAGHLLGNLWVLFLYGNAVNAKIGHWQYLVLYFAIGIIDSAIWLMLGDEGITLGASGAVMGIIGAFVVLYPRNDVSIFYWLFIVKMGTFQVSAYIVIAIYVLMDFVGLLGGGGTVNHIAHLGGMGLGFGAMMALAAAGLVKPDAGEQTMLDVLRGRKPQRDQHAYRLKPREDFKVPPPIEPPGAGAGPRNAGTGASPRPRAKPSVDAPIPLAPETPRASVEKPKPGTGMPSSGTIRKNPPRT